jgi:hypothetical protein
MPPSPSHQQASAQSQPNALSVRSPRAGRVPVGLAVVGRLRPSCAGFPNEIDAVEIEANEIDAIERDASPTLGE